MDRIVIKPEEFSLKIQQIIDLQNKVNELSKIDTVIIKSKGLVPDEIKNIEQNYLTIIQKYNSLFQTTITFLESISENLQETDEAMAQQNQIVEV